MLYPSVMFRTVLVCIVFLTIDASTQLRRRPRLRVYESTPTPVIYGDPSLVRSGSFHQTSNVIDLMVRFLHQTFDRSGPNSQTLPFVHDEKVDAFGSVVDFIKQHILDIVVITLACVVLAIAAIVLVV